MSRARGGGGGRGGGQRGGHGGGRGNGHRGGQGGSQQQERMTVMFCSHCNTNTHNTNNCYKLNNNNNNNSNNINNTNRKRKGTSNGNGNNGSQQRQTIICYQCNKKGHHGDNCNQNSNNNNNSSQPNITRPCSICEGWHLDRNCNAKSSQGTSISCKWCHKPHYNAQCPTKLNPNWKGSNNNKNNNSNALDIHAHGINGEPVTMSGYILRACMICNGNHLPTSCALRTALEPSYEAPTPPIASTHSSQPQHCHRCQHAASYSNPNPTGGGNAASSLPGNVFTPPQVYHIHLTPSPETRSSRSSSHASNTPPTVFYSGPQQHPACENCGFYNNPQVDQDNDVMMIDVDDLDGYSSSSS